MPPSTGHRGALLSGSAPSAIGGGVVRGGEPAQGAAGDGDRRGQDARRLIALAELLMRQNWVKRVLFLADRVPLVRQAKNAFKSPSCPTAVGREPGGKTKGRGSSASTYPPTRR
jgi:hypothetical protein